MEFILRFWPAKSAPPRVHVVMTLGDEVLLDYGYTREDEIRRWESWLNTPVNAPLFAETA